MNSLITDTDIQLVKTHKDEYIQFFTYYYRTEYEEMYKDKPKKGKKVDQFEVVIRDLVKEIVREAREPD
jgi:hypothetical protein